MTTMTSESRSFDRRTFTRGMGAMIVALSVPKLLDPRIATAAVHDEFPIGPALIDTNEIDSWIAVNGDGTVTVKVGKVELGQGQGTVQLALVADELDVPMGRVSLLQSDTWRTPDQGNTAGSQTSPTQFGPNGLRTAAAEARRALLELASQRLGVPVGNLRVSDGIATNAGNPSQRVTYAELIGGRTFNLRRTGTAQPKPYTEYKLIGTSVPRVDLPDIVFGKSVFTPDIRLPNLAHGRVVRPPTLGSKFVAIEGWEGGRRPPGLIRVFVRGNYVAVVAEREEQAIAAANSLKVRWDVGYLPRWDTYLDDMTTHGPSTNQVLQDSSFGGGPNVDTVLAGAPAGNRLSATYYFPIQLHGSMGSSGAAAWVKGNTATVYSATQNIYATRNAVATVLGIPQQNVRGIYVPGTGCYGINKADDVTIDAAVLSQAVGRPVRVQHSRADEMLWENMGAPYTFKLEGAVGQVGAKRKVIAFKRDAWSNARGGRPGGSTGNPQNMASGILMGFPEQERVTSETLTPSQPLNLVDGSNSAPSYILPAARITHHTVTREFLTGPLRSPARIQNTWAYESFMDELAHAAGVDPLDFRLDHLEDPRLIAVFRKAAELAKWEYRPTASRIQSGRHKSGRGIAGMLYEGNNGYGAAVVSVTVDTQTGRVNVNHVWGSQECGPVLNPDGMKAQAEGSVLQGISRTLLEEVRWTQSGILSRDWAAYPTLRFDRVPGFTFDAIDYKNAPLVRGSAPMGAGEVLITAMPAAIGNAVFDATGVRLRRLPFTPTRVRAALGGAV
jgi:CO/xanthine dehydrogenase Mo-binding subunit